MIIYYSVVAYYFLGYHVERKIRIRKVLSMSSYAKIK